MYEISYIVTIFFNNCRLINRNKSRNESLIAKKTVFPNKLLKEHFGEVWVEDWTWFCLQWAAHVLEPFPASDQFYLWYGLSLFRVVLKSHSIVAVLQLVLLHPFFLLMESLCCYSCYFSVLSSEIELKPRISIIPISYPSPLCVM